MILNKTTYQLYNIKIRKANNFLKRFMGLMGKRNIDFALIFCNMKDPSIHTFFMRFEIDVYFLDNTKRVIDKVSLKPWRFYSQKRSCAYIIETEKDALDIEVNDKLDFNV